jgi:hypothetical protein
MLKATALLPGGGSLMSGFLPSRSALWLFWCGWSGHDGKWPGAACAGRLGGRPTLAGLYQLNVTIPVGVTVSANVTIEEELPQRERHGLGQRGGGDSYFKAGRVEPQTNGSL